MFELKQESIRFHHILGIRLYLKRIPFFFNSFISNLFFYFFWLGQVGQPSHSPFFLISIRSKPIPIERNLFNEQKRGERGIRTPDSCLFNTIPVFKTGAINHSAISPKDNFYFIPTNRTWLQGVDATTICRKISGVNLPIYLSIRIQNPACHFVK